MLKTRDELRAELIERNLNAREQNVRVCFWPNPVVQASIAGVQVEKSLTVSTGRYRPKTGIRKSNIKAASNNRTFS